MPGRRAIYSTYDVMIWKLGSAVYVYRVLSTGTDNVPAVRVPTTKTVRYNSRLVPKPNLRPRGGPNLYPYPSTRGFCWVLLDLSGPISGFAFRVVLYMVPFRDPTVNRKILTLIHHCLIWMNWPSWNLTKGEARSLDHSENEHQQSVNDLRSC